MKTYIIICIVWIPLFQLPSINSTINWKYFQIWGKFLPFYNNVSFYWKLYIELYLYILYYIIYRVRFLIPFLCYPLYTMLIVMDINCFMFQYSCCFWLADHGKPVLFWNGTSGLKFPCFLLMHANGTGPFEFRAVPIL